MHAFSFQKPTALQEMSPFEDAFDDIFLKIQKKSLSLSIILERTKKEIRVFKNEKGEALITRNGLNSINFYVATCLPKQYIQRNSALFAHKSYDLPSFFSALRDCPIRICHHVDWVAEFSCQTLHVAA